MKKNEREGRNIPHITTPVPPPLAGLGGPTFIQLQMTPRPYSSFISGLIASSSSDSSIEKTKPDM